MQIKKAVKSVLSAVLAAGMLLTAMPLSPMAAKNDHFHKLMHPLIRVHFSCLFLNLHQPL